MRLESFVKSVSYDIMGQDHSSVTGTENTDHCPINKRFYTDYTKAYYFHHLAFSILWIKDMNINYDIIEQISLFSIGMVNDCNNDNCNYEVSIHEKDNNLFEKIKSLNNASATHDDIIQIINEHKDKDGIYYYNDKQSISYCTDCSKAMKPCGINKPGHQLCCKTIIFEKDNNSFINCSCTEYTKMLCLSHGKCSNCNVSFCGKSCQNIINKGDLCRSRKCSTCGKEGCPKCIPTTYYKACEKSYSGQVWKCKSNPNCK